MHDYLEKSAAIIEALRRVVFSLSAFEQVLFLGVVILASLVFLAIGIGWVRDKRKKRKHSLLERELYRVPETDGMRKGERRTVIDAFRIRFPLDGPPEKRIVVDDRMDALVAESERKVEGERRA